MARYKRILGDHLQARKLPGQQAEAAIGVAVLNRMMDAGRPGATHEGLRTYFQDGQPRPLSYSPVESRSEDCTNP